ncbi:MAG: hypothetical protein HYX69_17790 [Planctomycetia bacterium]|nr:hypothetical protein [Planctomycetia bacterium]
MPVVALTASAVESDRAQCLRSGFDGYVTKPLTGQQFFEAIERLVPEPHESLAAVSPEPIAP